MTRLTLSYEGAITVNTSIVPLLASHNNLLTSCFPASCIHSAKASKSTVAIPDTDSHSQKKIFNSDFEIQIRTLTADHLNTAYHI